MGQCKHIERSVRLLSYMASNLYNLDLFTGTKRYADYAGFHDMLSTYCSTFELLYGGKKDVKLQAWSEIEDKNLWWLVKRKSYPKI